MLPFEELENYDSEIRPNITDSELIDFLKRFAKKCKDWDDEECIDMFSVLEIWSNLHIRLCLDYLSLKEDELYKSDSKIWGIAKKTEIKHYFKSD